jgi:hypothetical protein
VAGVEPAKALVGRNNQCIGAFFIASKLPPWRSACREQESLRFRLWRHSHSVPVRWHRGVAAEAGVAQAALAVEQVEQAAQPEPQATQAARKAVLAATVLLNPPAAKAVRVAIALLSPPAARAKIASIHQGRELGREALVRALKSQCSKWHERSERFPRPCSYRAMHGATSVARHMQNGQTAAAYFLVRLLVVGCRRHLGAVSS